MFLKIAGTLLFLLAAIACSPPTSPSPGRTPKAPTPSSTASPLPTVRISDNEAIIHVVQRATDALNAEDINAYLKFVHPQSKFRSADYMSGLRTAFETFDVNNELSNLHVDQLQEDQARVTFVMFVDFNSPDFQNTKITGAYLLRKFNGEWLIFDDAIEKVEPMP